MESLSARRLESRMNECGAARRPFFFAVDFEMAEGIFSDDPFQERGVFFSINGRGNRGLLGVRAERKSSPFSSSPEPFSAYEKKFARVRAGLLRGDSFLTNLTVRTPIETEYSLEEIFLLSSAPYSVLAPGRFCCFSPEIFVKIEGRSVSTYPMKGTISAAIPGARETILSDFKESAEHATIVDLLRNDLSIFAKGVGVERYRYIDLLKTSEREILQVSSEIRGELPEDWRSSVGSVVFGMLPAGSCSGAPKESTLEIIRQAEDGPRGFYTGVAGLFDGDSLDSGVLIRFVEESGGKKHFRSGGGITAYSRAADEYNEAWEKIYLPFV